MAQRRSPLFSAVVLAGVSLTSTALTVACGDDESTPATGSPDASTSSSSGGSSSGGSSSGSSGAADGATDGAQATDAGEDACPDGSDNPTPPCNLIK